ncbi:hypothetical protein ES703_76065 [subsurface metagenome]
MSKFRLISIIISVIVIITFVTYNMHIIDIYTPFFRPVQIRVIFLLFIVFLLGSGTVVAIVMLNGHNKKIIERYNKNNSSKKITERQ